MRAPARTEALDAGHSKDDRIDNLSSFDSFLVKFRLTDDNSSVHVPRLFYAKAQVTMTKVDNEVDTEAAMKIDRQVATTAGRTKRFFWAVLLLSLVGTGLVGYTVWYFFFKTGCADDDLRLRRLTDMISKDEFQA
jgi:hypothetical protein